MKDPNAVRIYGRLYNYVKWMDRPRFFTAEDFYVHAFTPSEQGVSIFPRQLGAYFAAFERNGDIRRIGDTKAQRHTSHGRRIGVYERVV